MDCGLLWCFYQTLILTAPIHCRASITETHISKPDEETNSSWSRMNWGWTHFQLNVTFGWTIALEQFLTLFLLKFLYACSFLQKCSSGVCADKQHRRTVSFGLPFSAFGTNADIYTGGISIADFLCLKFRRLFKEAADESFSIYFPVISPLFKADYKQILTQMNSTYKCISVRKICIY